MRDRSRLREKECGLDYGFREIPVHHVGKAWPEGQVVGKVWPEGWEKNFLWRIRKQSESTEASPEGPTCISLVSPPKGASVRGASI